ncbi:MAG: glycosyltransferase [Gammaproteobacteria bacterium]|nr:glycosyltransferase [Gammaproteobacteria bacterium]
MTKQVLFIAFHFPPIQGSSGVHRSLAFTKYLPACGWQPTVLTVHPRAYESVREENLRLLPPTLRVERAFALDANRHLAIAGRYPDFLALPDKWQSWIVGGVLRGLALCRELKPAAIVSTYPIASAHVIGYALRRLTGIPWLADFRDPMLQNDFPHGAAVRRAFGWVERRVFAHADAVTVTTDGARRFYGDRYGAAATRKTTVIPNGFDPEMFPAPPGPAVPPPAGRPVKLLHSGLLYQDDRNPDPFFAAIAASKRDGALDAGRLQVTLRASGNDDDYRARTVRLGIDDIVHLEPPRPYQEALQEMLDSDGLLIFQSSGVNKQIPAKLYEYLYARRPILGLTDPDGDTGRLLAELGIDMLTRLEDEAAIRAMLPAFIDQIRAGTVRLPPAAAVEKLSRRSGTEELARLLDDFAA